MWLSIKLDWKHLGPFKVAKCIGLQAYKLALPAFLRYIYDTLHILLLDPIKHIWIPLHSLSPVPPATYVKDDHEYFEVEDILDSHHIQNRPQYLIKW